MSQDLAVLQARVIFIRPTGESLSGGGSQRFLIVLYVLKLWRKIKPDH